MGTSERGSVIFFLDMILQVDCAWYVRWNCRPSSTMLGPECAHATFKSKVSTPKYQHNLNISTTSTTIFAGLAVYTYTCIQCASMVASSFACFPLLPAFCLFLFTCCSKMLYMFAYLSQEQSFLGLTTVSFLLNVSIMPKRWRGHEAATSKGLQVAES